MTTDAADGPRKTRIWPYVILATLIASAWAAIASASGPVAATEMPDGTPDGITRALAQMAGYAIGSAIFASGLTWALFYVAVFLRRGAIAKAAFAFAIMSVVALLFSFSARFLAVAEHKSEVTASVTAWEDVTRTRGEHLRGRLAAQLVALKLNENNLATIERPQQVDEGLLRLQQGALLHSQYVRDLEAMFATAHAELDQLGLPDDAKQRLRRSFDTDFVAPARREADLDSRIGAKGVEIFRFLQSTKASWEIQDHRFMFHDQANLARFNALQADIRALRAQLPQPPPVPATQQNSAPAPSPTPTGSAPPR